MTRIGIDLGGTKIEGIALDPSGRELARRRVYTPRENYHDIVKTLADLVHWLESETGQTGTVGIGMPGVMSKRTGLVKNANLQVMIGKAFDADLTASLGRAVRIENDANCFAMSEAADGAGAGAPVVFGAILGTGCGGGIVVNGTVLSGLNSLSGEWGHNPLPWMTTEEFAQQETCYCGKRGCNEGWISGTGFAADYQRRTGEKVLGAEIIGRMQSGDAHALASFNAYCDRLARALASVVNFLDPDVIVLGGGMSNVGALYDRLPALLQNHCFSDGVDTVIKPAQHGDSSGVRGAAWLWPL